MGTQETMKKGIRTDMKVLVEDGKIYMPERLAGPKMGPNQYVDIIPMKTGILLVSPNRELPRKALWRKWTKFGVISISEYMAAICTRLKLPKDSRIKLTAKRGPAGRVMLLYPKRMEVNEREDILDTQCLHMMEALSKKRDDSLKRFPVIIEDGKFYLSKQLADPEMGPGMYVDIVLGKAGILLAPHDSLVPRIAPKRKWTNSSDAISAKRLIRSLFKNFGYNKYRGRLCLDAIKGPEGRIMILYPSKDTI